MQKCQYFLWNCGRKNNGKKMQSGSRGCALLHRKVHNPEDLRRSQAGDLRSNKFPLDIQSTGFYFLTTQSTQCQYLFTILVCLFVCMNSSQPEVYDTSLGRVCRTELALETVLGRNPTIPLNSSVTLNMCLNPSESQLIYL